jgi:hypoxanthine phosphoribosyltransferase
VAADEPLSTGGGPALARCSASPPGADPVHFAHESERQFARLLDFYGVAWMYEPTEFTLEWDDGGRPARGFRPDFYLPAYDTYIEITTLNQKLVTKKNRKVRRLRELHPNVEIKILYQRDYLNLLVKFGLDDTRVIPLLPRDAAGAPPVTDLAGVDGIGPLGPCR